MTSLKDITLSSDEFIRSIQVNSKSRFMLFLGAGASVTSGMPSAYSCIWDWKRRIFLTKNLALKNLVTDVSVTSVQDRIQTWLQNNINELPPRGSLEEYGFFIEKCFPIPDDRRSFFHHYVATATPHVGYKQLCLLAESKIVKEVWTTNFDGLTPKAAGQFKITPVEIGLDSTNRINRTEIDGELLHISLHGDYRYDLLKNTEDEIKNQDTQLLSALVEKLKDNNLIVIGYSGRDRSIMEALSKAYATPGAGRLYWCGFEDHQPIIEVEDLLLSAKNSGRDAFYVQGDSFDLMMSKLALTCLSDDKLKIAQKISEENSTALNKSIPPFEIPPGQLTAVIKNNSFPISMPAEAFQFEHTGFGDNRSKWFNLKKLLSGKSIVATFRGPKLLFLGDTNEAKAVFKSHIKGNIERIPLQNSDTYDGATFGLFREAVVRSLAEKFKLETDNKKLVWRTASPKTFSYNNLNYYVYDALSIFLRNHNGQSYLLLKPTIKVLDKSGMSVGDEIEMEGHRKFLTKQYNKQFSTDLESWYNLLFKESVTVLQFPQNNSSIKFSITKMPTYTGVLGGSANKVTFPLERIIFNGARLEEPKLIFSDSTGNSPVSDTHQLRGLIANKPFDFSLTQSGLSSEIKVGVICTKNESQKLKSYLDLIHNSIKADSKDEYLVDYPGFANATGTPVKIPSPGDTLWQECGEVSSDLPQIEGSKRLVEALTSAINRLCSSTPPNVIVILVPNKWKKFEKYDLDGEVFNLHNHLKALCVRKGVSTQLLRESTFQKQYQCEVRWWLAMSLYVKSFRSPWILDGLDQSTAYVGIGFGIEKSKSRKSEIVIGCSHIYDSTGQGLKYRLSKVDNPVWKGKNPHLSKDDARKLGNMIRQLFYESAGKLPSRVVIHKNTPFLEEEQNGLLQGLGQLDSIELIEVVVDKSWRGIAARNNKGKWEVDGFPVKRGTVVKIEKNKALLWVHGSASGLSQNRTYYLGKSRIPAPLLITRHYGSSSLSTVASEVLGLSKMNWNSFDLYNKLPATLESSTEIARIGSLLERFGPSSYDYRLFI